MRKVLKVKGTKRSPMAEYPQGRHKSRFLQMMNAFALGYILNPLVVNTPKPKHTVLT